MLVRGTYCLTPATFAMCSTWLATADTLACPSGAMKWGAKLTYIHTWEQISIREALRQYIQRLGRRTYHDNSILLTFSKPDESKYVVGNVTRYVVNSSRGGVRPDHGCFGVIQSLSSSIVACVAQVYKNPQSVHLIDKQSAKVTVA
jgi:hypothetical protein